MIEYIRHGSAANVFNNVDEFNITLGVLNNSDMSCQIAEVQRCSHTHHTPNNKSSNHRQV